MEIATFDHLPLHLQLNKQVYIPRSKRLIFENACLKEKECFGLVKNSWEFMEGKSIIDKISYCCFRLDEWGGGASQEFKKKLMEC